MDSPDDMSCSSDDDEALADQIPLAQLTKRFSPSNRTSNKEKSGVSSMPVTAAVPETGIIEINMPVSFWTGEKPTDILESLAVGVNFLETISGNEDEALSSDYGQDHQLHSNTPNTDVLNVAPPDSNSEDDVRDLEEIERGRPRKPRVQPNTWQRHQRKLLRARGEAYINVKGQTVSKRKMGDGCKEKCRYKCHQKINKARRENIFQSYWASGNYERQRDFICNHVVANNTQEDASRKKFSFQYFLVNGDNSKTRVCKTFFLETLGIRERTVSWAVKKKTGAFCANDKRGKKVPSNKIPDDEINRIKKHIRSFPAVESHYCRASSKRRYLAENLSVGKMYGLYVEKCEKELRRPQKICTYRKVFNSQFNLGFHRPKKDQCAMCAKVQNSTEDSVLREYRDHINRKEQCRIEKQNDKARAEIDPTHTSLTFDLQKVLATPSSPVSLFYYKRKLSTYNFTVYNQKTHEGTCYLWSEDEGGRGSCEIGSCLMKHIQDLPEYTRSVGMFSDCCGGQNRNKFIAAALSYLVRTCDNIETVDQMFLESGHTQMEVDSMHSCIEFSKKHVDIFHPAEWVPVIRLARRRQPYKVVEMKHGDFVDLKNLEKNLFKNTKVDCSGENVNWLKIKHLRFEKNDPCTLKFRHNFTDEFRQLKVSGRRRSLQDIAVKLYDHRLPISEAKKRDLVSLCDTMAIPLRYQDFYRSLPSSKTQRDALPQSDEEDAEDDIRVEE